MTSPPLDLKLDRRRALTATGLGLATLLADTSALRAAVSGQETVALTTPSGRRISGVLARPKTLSGTTVILIHEWWGLNDQMKAVAGALAQEGHNAVAVDLFNGSSTDDPAKAKTQIDGVKPDEAKETLRAWVAWARGLKAGGKVATMGFCFGGGWSLNASLADPVEGTVIYYGNVDKTAAELAALKGPVLGHFASRDAHIDKAMVGRFEAAIKAAGKMLTLHWYDADHGFANPTTARYDAPDAQLAWSRTTAFLKGLA